MVKLIRHYATCIFAFAFCALAACYAEEALENTAAPESASAAKEGAVASVSGKSYDFFIHAGPLLLVNTDSHSAPSPIVFAAGFGMDFFKNRAITFEPSLSFFTNYYLWDGEAAHPAEVENRTAFVASCLVDIRALKAWQRGQGTLLVGGGVGILARYGFDGSKSSAADDVKAINSWLWQSARFLYPELVYAWRHQAPNAAVSAGVQGCAYVPVGSLISGRGLDAAISSLSFVLAF